MGALRKIVPVLVLLGATAPATADEAIARLEFSGIEAFWRIVSILEDDRSPDERTWEQLLSSPGYRALTESEFPPEFFRRSFELVFMPSKAEELERALEAGRGASYLNHYVRVKERRPELDRQVETLRTSLNLQAIAGRALEYLPSDVAGEVAQVSFVIFANDGRGYDPIVIDLLASMTWEFEPFLAHELHHWYRNRRRVYDPDSVDSVDAELVNTLDQLEAEGLADFIDKRPWIVDPSSPLSRSADYERSYRDHLDSAPALIGELDALLARYRRAPLEERAAIGSEVSELVPLAGHPTGYFMADLILEQLGREVLLAGVGNPFAFARRFSEAAMVSGRQDLALSPDTLALLDALESALRSKRSLER